MPADQNTAIQLNAPFSLDNKYTNNGAPWANTAAVLSAAILQSAYRSQGLTVLIGKREYWWRDGTADNQLVLKGNYDTILTAVDVVYVMDDEDMIGHIVAIPTIGAPAGFKIGSTNGGEEISPALALVNAVPSTVISGIYANGAQNLYFGGITGSGATVKIKIFKY